MQARPRLDEIAGLAVRQSLPRKVEQRSVRDEVDVRHAGEMRCDAVPGSCSSLMTEPTTLALVTISRSRAGTWRDREPFLPGVEHRTKLQRRSELDALDGVAGADDEDDDRMGARVPAIELTRHLEATDERLAGPQTSTQVFDPDLGGAILAP